jgi:hypothetical protein
MPAAANPHRARPRPGAGTGDAEAAAPAAHVDGDAGHCGAIPAGEPGGDRKDSRCCAQPGTDGSIPGSGVDRAEGRGGTPLGVRRCGSRPGVPGAFLASTRSGMCGGTGIVWAKFFRNFGPAGCVARRIYVGLAHAIKPPFPEAYRNESPVATRDPGIRWPAAWRTNPQRRAGEGTKNSRFSPARRSLAATRWVCRNRAVPFWRQP